MASTVNKIAKRVSKNLLDEGMRQTQFEEILDAMEDAQLDVAVNGWPLQDQSTIKLTADRTDYQLNKRQFRIKAMMRPTTWIETLEVIHDMDVWVEKLRETLSYSYPVFATIWDHVLRLYPAPPTTGEELVLYSYREPLLELIEGGDLEIPRRWERALEYKTTDLLMEKQADYMRISRGRVVPAKYANLYQAKLFELKTKDLKGSHTGVRKVQHSSNEIGY
jgi:hypothetical protein